MRRVVVAIVLMLVPFTVPVAPAASFYLEDWESGTDGWSITGDPGLTVNCGFGAPGCSLRSELPCCQGHAAEKALNVPLASDRTIVAEVMFYTELTSNSLWPSFEVLLDAGSAKLLINHNEQERLRFETMDGGHDFGARYGRFEWYKAQIMLRGQTAIGRLLDGAGNPMGDSIVLGLPEATRITGLRVANAYPNEWRDTVYHFDNVALYDTPNCFPFVPTLSSVKTVAEYPYDPGFILGVTGGHASCESTWSLAFGDGSAPVSGTGMPPASVPHTYEAAGTYTATLTVTMTGQTRTATRQVVATECSPLTASMTSLFTEGPAPFVAQVSTSTGSALERCGTTWRLDWGDGSPILTGTGAAPTGLTHTYTNAGVYVARFEAVRDGATVSATRIFAAGPYEEVAEGSFLAGVRVTIGGVTGFEHRVDLKPTDGTDTLRITWNAAVPSDLDVYFARGGQRLATTGCFSESTFGVESCTVPRGADSYVVTARTALDADWRAVVKYA